MRANQLVGLGAAFNQLDADVRRLPQIFQNQILPGPIGKRPLRLIRLNEAGAAEPLMNPRTDREMRDSFPHNACGFALNSFVEIEHGHPQRVFRLLAKAFAERDAQHKDEDERHREQDDHRSRIADKEAQVLSGERPDDHRIAPARRYTISFRANN